MLHCFRINLMTHNLWKLKENENDDIILYELFWLTPSKVNSQLQSLSDMPIFCVCVHSKAVRRILFWFGLV
jgi:hypothetical protein